MTNTPTQAAIEAAARAIVRRNYPSATDRDIDMMWEGYQPDAQAAIEAYRAAMREAGVVEVNLAELERAGVVLTAREEG